MLLPIFSAYSVLVFIVRYARLSRWSTHAIIAMSAQTQYLITRRAVR